MPSSRRLSAIMFTDMVGFTALAQRNESLSLELLEEERGQLRPIFQRHDGREVKTIGDGFLVEFPNALEAVRCAFDIQQSSHERNLGRPPGRRVLLRVGVHLGDVVDEGGDITGDAVNVASRIQPLADDGGVCLTRQVHDQVQNKLEVPLVSMGPRALKNVAAPLEVYKMALPWDRTTIPEAKPLDKSRVAVLPFVNISPDPNDEFFADGLTEEVIASLALVKGLKVIARTSVMNYKRKEKNVSEIGRELGTGTVVEGSVRKSADRIRVTVQVIDVATEEHLWACSYDDRLNDVFAVQRDIAEKVAAALPTRMAPSSRARSAATAADPQAYLLFLQGQALVYRHEERALRQSLKFFEEACERDPKFARAYSSAARAYIRLGEEGHIAWRSAIDQGRASAQKARAIDPELAEAHGLLAETSFMADDPVAVTEEEARRATELNPNLGEAHDILGQVAGLKGDLDRYVREIETAYQLDPLSPLTIRFLGRAYFISGRIEEALKHWERTLESEPIAANRGFAEYHIWKKDFGKAQEYVRELERLAPTSTQTLMISGYLAGLRGDRATALKIAAELDAIHDPGWARSEDAGYIYLGLGDLDKFFEYMFAAFRDHTLSWTNLLNSPLFEDVRKDPRFQQLVTLTAARFFPNGRSKPEHDA